MKITNFSQKQISVFPENTILIITELLKRYGLKETPKDVFEKIHKEEEPFGTTVAKSVKEIAEGKAQIKDLPNLLQKRLNLPVEKAKQMTIDIKKEILDLAKKFEEKTPVSITQKQEKVEEKPSPLKKDIYREPTE